MNAISLIGIIVGIIFFIVCCYKQINMFFAALVASIIIMVFSKMPILGSINDLWLATFAGFIKGYALIFIGSCLFGQTLSDGKASRALAVAFAGVIRKSKNNQKLLALLFVPLMYMVLGYAGISGFVIVFTVLAMARDIFQECDIPWRFYCYGGASNIGTLFLGGSLQLSNIQLADICGTRTTAAMGLSIVGFVVFYLVVVICAYLDIRKCNRTGEGFMDSGSNFKNEDIGKDTGDKENLPSVFLSLVPLLAVVIIAAVFNQILIALLVGIILNIILFKKNITSLKTTLANGITQSYTPIINVAATVAVSAIVASAPGFSVVVEAMGALSPMYQGIGLTLLISLLTTGPTGAYEAFGSQILAGMVAEGYTPEIVHRILSASAFTSVGPHSAGPVNTTMLARLEYGKAVPVYLRISIIPGFFALLAMVLCVNLGLFW